MRAKIKKLLPATVISYFTTGAQRSINVKRNIVISLAIRCFNIAISFLLVPLTINYVNPTQYGIWITLSSIIAWFSFFDIGFGNGLRNKFAEAIALGKHKLARVYVSTTYAALTIIISAVLAIFLIANNFLDWSQILNSPPAMSQELSTLALIVFVFFCIQFILQLITVVVTANHEPAKAAIFKFYANVLSLVLIYILINTSSGNLLLLGTILGLSPIVTLAGASIYFYQGKYRRYAPKLSLVNFRFARPLMNLGVKFFIIQASGIVLYSTHNIIITQLFGPADVTPYHIAYKYFSAVTIVFSIILTPFWSAFTDAFVKNDLGWIRRAMRSSVALALGFVLVVLLMVVFSQSAFDLWIGDTVSVPLTLTILMGVYFSINLLLQPFTFFINGTGRLRLQLTYSVVTALINIPLAVLLAGDPRLGINGLVIASIICYLPSLLLGPIQYRKLLNGNAKGIWNK